MQVFATNAAGITGEAQSQNFKVDVSGNGLGGLKTGVVVAICIVVVVIAVALITLLIFRWRWVLLLATLACLSHERKPRLS